MKQVSYDGIGQVMATFPAALDSQGADKVTEGAPVKMGAAGTVDLCGDGDAFIGVAMTVRDGCAGVQVRGFVTLPASGSIATGLVTLAANGSGGVKQVSSGGTAYLVAESNGGSVTILL